VSSDHSAASLRMEDVMTTDVVTVDPDSSLDACITLMKNHRVRYLPVLQADRVMGIVSLSDVVKALSRDELEFLSLFPESGAFEKHEI
jgi:CBS domain-containing protein